MCKISCGNFLCQLTDFSLREDNFKPARYNTVSALSKDHRIPGFGLLGISSPEGVLEYNLLKGEISLKKTSH